MKLYFAPRTRAVRPRWLLEELGVPYELATSEQLKEIDGLPPGAEAPVLIDGPVALFESTAICLYLADRFPEKGLAPPLGSTARAEYLEAVLTAEVRLEPLLVENLRTGSQVPDDRLTALLRTIDQRLGDREFILGNAFTAADLVMASLLHLAHRLHLLDTYPRLLEYVRRHTARPASRRAVS